MIFRDHAFAVTTRSDKIANDIKTAYPTIDGMLGALMPGLSLLNANGAIPDTAYHVIWTGGNGALVLPTPLQSRELYILNATASSLVLSPPVGTLLGNPTITLTGNQAGTFISTAGFWAIKALYRNATIGTAWGTITGTLAAQADLQGALDLKIGAAAARRNAMRWSTP